MRKSYRRSHSILTVQNKFSIAVTACADVWHPGDYYLSNRVLLLAKNQTPAEASHLLPSLPTRFLVMPIEKNKYRNKRMLATVIHYLIYYLQNMLENLLVIIRKANYFKLFFSQWVSTVHSP